MPKNRSAGRKFRRGPWPTRSVATPSPLHRPMVGSRRHRGVVARPEDWSDAEKRRRGRIQVAKEPPQVPHAPAALAAVRRRGSRSGVVGVSGAPLALLAGRRERDRSAPWKPPRWFPGTPRGSPALVATNDAELRPVLIGREGLPPATSRAGPRTRRRRTAPRGTPVAERRSSRTAAGRRRPSPRGGRA